MSRLPETAVPYLLWGALRRPNRRVELRAGRLACVVEPESGFLRYVRWGGHELLRGVYVAVRGPGWVTIPVEVSSWRVEDKGGESVLSYHAVCKSLPIWFEWDGRIEARSDDTIVYEFDGVARATFARNRIGCCVLHPDTCAGMRCTVEHVDGTITHGRLPYLVEPHQPFTDIRAVSVSWPSGVATRVEFEGDVFEMEDQRNWTDASFKTYSTPLRLPIPVEVAEGTRIWQRVTIRAQGLQGEGRHDLSSGNEVKCVLSEERLRVLEVGLGVPWWDELGGEDTVRRLRSLRPAHLRVELHLGGDGWSVHWARACAIAREVGVPLEVALVFDGSVAEMMKEFARACRGEGADVVRCFALGEGKKILPGEEFEIVMGEVRKLFPRGVIGAGTNRYFTELNRGRPCLEGAGAVVYSCNPQVHVFDNASIVETCAGQRWTVRTAQSFCCGLPVYVSPITLKSRPVPTGTVVDDKPPAWADIRQVSLFGAGFALGSLAALAEAGAAGVTLFDAYGWNGVMDGPSGGWLQYVSGLKGVYPVYHVLADVAERCDADWYRVEVSDPLRVAALGLRTQDGNRVLLSNLTADELTVSLACSAEEVGVRVFDEVVIAEALSAPEAFRARAMERRRVSCGMLTLRLRANAYVQVVW